MRMTVLFIALINNWKNTKGRFMGIKQKKSPALNFLLNRIMKMNYSIRKYERKKLQFEIQTRIRYIGFMKVDCR